MKVISYLFFYTYVGLVLAAGFWGAFVNPAFDFRFLFNADIKTLPDQFRINLLSQYRFLRALEFGFGLYAILFRKEIFNLAIYNRLFLIIMGCGIISRIVSVFADGHPNSLSYFFLFYELTGFIFIFFYTKDKFFNESISSVL